MSRPWPPAEPSAARTAGGQITAVLCAAFDSATDTAVLAVRDSLIRTGVRLPARPRHRPHLTLAAVRVHPDRLPAVVDAAADLAAGQHQFDVVLARVGTFNRAGALWLGPSERGGPVPLRDLHRSALAVPGDGGWEPAFAGRNRSGHWVPHCSVATRLPGPRLAELRALLATSYRPITATIAGVAIIVVGGSGDAGLTSFGA